MTQNNPHPHKNNNSGTALVKKRKADALLVEIAWEVANQVGGIYRVIATKVPSIQQTWGDRYCLIGPYIHPNVDANFEPIESDDSPFFRAAEKMRTLGFKVHYGHWLVNGRPKVVLFEPYSVFDRLGEIKYLLWEHHGISLPGDDDLINNVVAFGWLIKVYLTRLTEPDVNSQTVIAHVHEWMAATAIPEIRRDNLPIRTIFTTHATMLGRYLAQNDSQFYDHLPFYDWAKEAKYFNIEPQAYIERAAAHGAHIFSTVSEVTARECESLIGRKPEAILPNGWVANRFDISHEIQNIHQQYKEQIHQFVTGHFFQNYSFDLDKTLYFFSAGRYEYRNKGYDLALEALARLNWRMKETNIDCTVVMFFIAPRPFHSINPAVLQNRATLETIRMTTEKIKEQVGEKLLEHIMSGEYSRFPNVSDFIDDRWKIRLRRNIQTWNTNAIPPVVTHNLVDDANDEILNFLRAADLLNYKEDRVKVVYHPEFVSTNSPLFGMDYLDLAKGSHLGVFPSYYEPWGYTPMESISFGVPAITSDLAGFGDYLIKNFKDPAKTGMYVVRRTNKTFDEAANELADQMYGFVQMSRLDRIQQRYQLVDASTRFDWKILVGHYEEAYDRVLEIVG